MSTDTDVFPSFFKAIQCKSNDKANYFLEMAEQSLKKKSMLESLIYLNKAISFSSSNFMLSISYANRSAVYFELEKYEECLKSIQLAREYGFAENIKKLDKREKTCKKILEANPDKTKELLEFFNLSYPANSKIPWIVDCIELRKSPEYGIYAKQNLKPGDILSIEEPFICFLRDDAYYKHCFNCLKTCMLNLIPCIRTASIMFCSIKCMETTYCKIDEMHTILFDDVKILSAIADSFESIKELDDFVTRDNLNQLNSTLFDYDFSDSNEPNNKNLLSCLLSLPISNYQDIHINNCTIQKSASKKTSEHILKILLFKNITHMFIGSGKSELFNDAASIPLFAGLINHSCTPNVQPIFVDNKIVICVSKPIKAGEQLFCTYLNQVSSHNKVMKKVILMHYNLKCDCTVEENFKLSLPTIPLSIRRIKSNKFKEFLAEGWKNIINSKSTEEIKKVQIQNFAIMEQIAYHCSFPC